MNWFKIVFPIILFSTLSAWAKVVDLSQSWLYKRYEHKDYYAKAVAMIKPGDVVKFKDGQTFTIEEKLGNGGLSYIFSIRERPHQILRLANSLPAIESIEKVRIGYQELVDTGVRVVEVDPQSTNQYVLAEKISGDYLTVAEMILNVNFGQKRFFYDGAFAYNSFVQRWRSMKIAKMESLDPELRIDMMNSFWLFLKSIAQFHYIGDLQESNFVYDRHNDEWIVIDWLDGSHKITHPAMIEESVSVTMEKMFLFIDEARANGFKMSKTAEEDLKMIQQKTKTLLIKEKSKYLQQLGTRAQFGRFRCQDLLKGSPKSN